MPGGDVYTALERGTIDATEWGTLWEDKAVGFHQVTKYVIIPGVHQPTAPFELVINPESWAELSESDQELIRTAAFNTTLNSWLSIGQNDAEAVQFYKDEGNEIIEPRSGSAVPSSRDRSQMGRWGRGGERVVRKGSGKPEGVRSALGRRGPLSQGDGARGGFER
ncbi:type 2 periplasmic-binding domain-containing protein [Jiella pelagia]|uniref:Uncharacterized protein n=1 Tax=Jiella pelagia TaxID=2986949 RepID=A0ABY7BZH4_9HYPH|nr:hypothetical protein [Jiella pelagia]WAP68921.1 hypothetical protein OH818_27570 [Jiella pelagia]